MRSGFCTVGMTVWVLMLGLGIVATDGRSAQAQWSKGCCPPRSNCPECEAQIVPEAEPGAEPQPADTLDLRDLQPDLYDEPLFDNPRFAALGGDNVALGGTPNMIGDFFGGGSQKVLVKTTVSSAFSTFGFLVSGASGDPNASLVFEANGGTPNDFTSLGVGTDASGDGLPDTFAMSEPLPANEVPVSPGQSYVYDGGTVVFTNTPGPTTAQDGSFDNGESWYASYSFSESIYVNIPAAGGAALRRVKLAENNSPIPRNRVYFSYNFFNDVIGGLGDVNQYTFGVEKTFFGDLMSIDIRVPFASTLGSVQSTDGSELRDTEFGNLTFIWKAILFQTANTVYTGGVGLGTPTGRNTRLFRPGGVQILELENNAFHLLPYLAAASNISESLFVQGFVQFDFDLNGNPVRADVTGNNLARIGKLRDASLLYLDVAMGYWLYRSSRPGDTISGITPVAELHYTTTLQDAATVSGGGITAGGITNRYDVLNLTLGTHFLMGTRGTITPGFSVPLRNGEDEQFDYEAGVQINWLF